MRTIVVGYDGTRPAERALERAAEIAKALGGTVLVASCAPLGDAVADVPVGAFGLVPFAYPVADAEHADDPWREHREHVSAYLDGIGVDHDFESALGRPAEEICEIAQERGADLIVVGTREPGFVDRLLTGSVSQGVARRAHCDVLIVHPPHDAEAAA